jgi:hypothetical protein
VLNSKALLLSRPAAMQMATEETAKDEEGGPRKRRRDASDEVTTFFLKILISTVCTRTVMRVGTYSSYIPHFPTFEWIWSVFRNWNRNRRNRNRNRRHRNIFPYRNRNRNLITDLSGTRI